MQVYQARYSQVTPDVDNPGRLGVCYVGGYPLDPAPADGDVLWLVDASGLV
ncbi:MAG: hypothetical protein Q7K03_10795 [Dehalococcoidia bacterium]|nr:hypothetical protein [Dehalococcoidia bacterium]